VKPLHPFFGPPRRISSSGRARGAPLPPFPLVSSSLSGCDLSFQGRRVFPRFRAAAWGTTADDGVLFLSAKAERVVSFFQSLFFLPGEKGPLPRIFSRLGHVLW